MIGVPASELNDLRMQGDEDAANRIYNQALFKTYHLRVSQNYDIAYLYILQWYMLIYVYITSYIRVYSY